MCRTGLGIFFDGEGGGVERPLFENGIYVTRNSEC